MKKIVSIILAVAILLAITAVTCSAAEDYDSPGGKPYYSIDVDTDGDGSATADKSKISKTASGDDTKVKLSGTSKGGDFLGWTIEGDYEIVSGTLKDLELEIIPKSDIKAYASFSSSSSSKTTTTEKTTTSPKTGDATPYAVCFVMIALAGAVFAVKKIKEN